MSIIESDGGDTETNTNSYFELQEPIPFISFDEELRRIFYLIQEFRLSEESEALLKTNSGPFSLISIIGQVHSGKSYLLNKILMRPQNGFKVGAGNQPCTQNLWIYSKPVIGSDANNERLPIFLLDSEGWSFQKEKNHNHDYFSQLMVLVWISSSY
jgi:hypothetical protein